MNAKRIIAIFVLLDCLLVLGLVILLSRDSNIYVADSEYSSISLFNFVADLLK